MVKMMGLDNSSISSGCDSDTSSDHSTSKRKLAAAAAAGAGLALGAQAIKSKYRESHPKPGSSPSTSRSSSPDPVGGVGAAAGRDKKKLGKKIAISVGVGTLALGAAGVAGTAAFIHHKRKEHKKNDKGPFHAKLTSSMYGKLDTGDPFGLRRPHRPEGHGVGMGGVGTAGFMEMGMGGGGGGGMGGGYYPAGGAGGPLYDEQYAPPGVGGSGGGHGGHRKWGTAALGAATGLVGGLFYRKHHDGQATSNEFARPDGIDIPYATGATPGMGYMAPSAPPENPFSASPSPEFKYQRATASPMDPFGNDPSHDIFPSYMGDAPGSIISPIGFAAADMPVGGAGGYSGGRGGDSSCGGRGGDDFDVSHRVHTSLNLCDDTGSSFFVSDTKDFDCGNTRAPRSPALSRTSSVFSSDSRASSAPSIFDDDCVCGCDEDEMNKKGDLDIFKMVNRGKGISSGVGMTGGKGGKYMGEREGEIIVYSSVDKGMCC